MTFPATTQRQVADGFHGAHRRKPALVLVAATILLWIGFCGSTLLGQEQELPRPVVVDTPGPDVELNLDGTVPLDALIGYIAGRLNLRIEYDDAIAARKVTVRSPGTLPVSSLPILLGNVLRTEQLVLIEDPRTGWKRIIPADQMTSVSQVQPGIRGPATSIADPITINPPMQSAPTDASPRVVSPTNPATPITQVFVLENLSAESVTQVLQPFLSGTSANLSAVPGSNTLIVTDYAASIETLSDLITLIDKPAGSAGFLLYEAKHQSSDRLSEQVIGLLKTSGDNDIDTRQIQIIPQPLGNRIIVAGSTAVVQKAESLLKRLDVALGVTTSVYRIRNTSAQRIDKLIGGFIEPPNDSESAYQSTVDEEGNLLIVRASSDVHRQIADLIEQLDQAVESDGSPIQFYKLKNASAIDVLYSLLALQEAVGAGPYATASGFGPFGGIAPTALNALTPMGLAGPNLVSPLATATGQTVPMTSLPLPPASGSRFDQESPTTNNPLAQPTLAAGPQANGLARGFASGVEAAGGYLAGGGVATLPGGARVSADVSTNSLIVFAPAGVQPMYAKLIESLDQRRPQVLIEAKVIAVSTSDDYTLGVEVSVGDREGIKRLFKFSSFGLSEVNPDTGALRIIPGLGFNGTLIDPEVADVVVRALAQHERSRVLAAPKILVNDNSTGTLESVVSVPFASVNASDTVATTSLGGDQTAGTIITVTPHINEDDHLQLEFDVEFSTFSGQGADGLPPPRQIDRVGSIVTIPSGKTVVVGGLKRTSEDHNFAGIPWAEKIPVIRELTSRTDDGYSTTSFFLFIRPIVLRDSRFADLKYLSQNELSEQCLPGDYPSSRPELIP
ncbi:putative type II secretion system protein D precursor [Crateriforma conspicua]|uniref:Putative type II secretion system protein D n=1 Tax=Crateriforma conspicua TaxID=2527996 RepID=A0A5C6FNJ9_9PLAN|nr:putative type II secretion system protein D precursor [Crateriforma conspicua]